MRTPVRLLYGAAAVLVLAGFAARIAPARLWIPDRDALDKRERAATPAAVARGAGLPDGGPGSADGSLDIIVSTNLFSAQRSASAARFADSTSAPPPVHVAPARHVVGVFGIGTTGGRATALLDADPTVPGAEIYHEGDALPGGGRVVLITGDHVVIETPEGRATLRLRAAPAAGRPSSSPPETP